MKKVISLLVALVMLLSMAAFAEPSKVGCLGISDLKVAYNGETIIDLSGVEVNAGIAVTDSGVLGLVANILAGGEMAASGAVQLTGTEVAAHLEGMDSVYAVDIANFLDEDTAAYLGMLEGMQLYTLLSGETESVNLTVADMAVVRSGMVDALSMLKTEDTEDGFGFALTEEMCAAVLEQLVALIGQVDADSAQELSDMQLSLAVEGTVARNEDAWTVTATGTAASAMDAETVIPLALTWTGEAGSDVLKLDVCDPEDKSVMVSLIYNGEYTDSVCGSVDFAVKFAAEMMGSEMGSFGVSYTAAEAGTGYRAGKLTLDAAADGESIGIDTGIKLTLNDMDSADWMIDTSAAVDVMSITEEQENAAMMSALGALTQAMTVLENNAPNAAAMLQSMLGM